MILEQPNAVHPYRWEAEYRDGTVVRQFDPVQGFQRSTVIDPRQIMALRVLGAGTPIRLQRPLAHAPDEVRIQATTDVSLTLGAGITGVAKVCWFGYRYGTQWFLLRIDGARATITDHFD